MAEKIGVIISLVFAIASFIISMCSFQEKGVLLNNAYLYASKEERDNMDKSPYYRQSAIVFLFCGIIFLLCMIDVLFCVRWIFYVVIILAVITLIYAIISSIIIEKKKNKYCRKE